MRLLITRPAEDAGPLAAALAERGIGTLTAPMLTVEDAGGPDPDLDGVQALLITSANGIRAFARRRGERDIAVYAVGEASAAAARGLGFADVTSAEGDVAALAALVRAAAAPAAGALLHVAGSHVAGDLGGLLAAAGFDVRRQVLYRAKAISELDAAAAAAIAGGALDGVLLFSPRTADVFADRVTEAGLAEACAGLTAYCLSPAVAERIGALPWRRVVVAPAPDQAALLDAIGG